MSKKEMTYSITFFLFWLVLFSSGENPTSRRISETVEQSDPIPKNEQSVYDFIFGWSTGHVGTTSLSEAKLYGFPSSSIFLLEGRNGPFRIHQNLDTGKWKSSDFESDYFFVKNVFIPFMLTSRSEHKTLVDLGHNNLYFMEALLTFLTNETDYRVMFVRVRRERLESALSLMYQSPGDKHDDLCEDLLYRLCPMDRTDAVILTPPSIQMWKNMSNFQQALWMGDEVEARWVKYKELFPTMEHIEIEWSKAWEGSFDMAANRVARLLGVQGEVRFNDTWHIRVHAGDVHQDQLATPVFATQDRLYRRAMGYKYQQG